MFPTGVAALGNGFSFTHLTTLTGSNTDSFSQAAVNFGTPAANRYIFVVATAGDNDVADSSFTAAVTLGGVAATVGHSDATVDSGAGDTGYGWIGGALVPTGNTGTVAVTLTGFSGTMDTWKISVYRVTAIQSLTPTATVDGSGATLTIPAGGFGFFAAYDAGGLGAVGNMTTNSSTEVIVASGAGGSHTYDLTAGTWTTGAPANADRIIGAAYL